MPTTLGVGVALVTQCKGNAALALLLTVSTNALAILTIPLTLKLLFAGDTSSLQVGGGGVVVYVLDCVVICTCIV